MFLNNGLTVVEVYLDLACAEQVFSTETEAYTRAKVVTQRQTARIIMAIMPPVSFLAVLVSAIFLILLTPTDYKQEDHHAKGAGCKHSPQQNVRGIACFRGVVEVSCFLDPPFEIGDQVFILIVISGLHPSENGESPFTDCIGGQILTIRQPQQPTEIEMKHRKYIPRHPCEIDKKTYFIKLCTLCRLSGRYSPMLQRNYNAILRKKQVEPFNFCHFFEKISELRLSKRVTS